ncbi:MAG: Hypothetical protein BHV28_16140 [Candidatus Tokpelaia hoelldobleri]|uniref:Surface antigen domain-containing protein n=1 Tax=Candidatus Tokpelaia hoelldobleri TaxID=1902579 RepID=A0A1U9JWM8_9HYPH|nr:MAG: Hypothetical protein BHV28_16140 [Candidatus Tokpelaia hoelldoblerii]
MTFFKKPYLGLPVLVVLGLSIQGCVVSGNQNQARQADRSLVTSAVTADKGNIDDALPPADQQVIRDFVAKAGKNQGNVLVWTSQETGNRGTISALADLQENGHACRTFQTTRESYDGVLLFSGKACNISGNVWTMTDLKAL